MSFTGYLTLPGKPQGRHLGAPYAPSGAGDQEGRRWRLDLSFGFQLGAEGRGPFIRQSPRFSALPTFPAFSPNFSKYAGIFANHFHRFLSRF